MNEIAVELKTPVFTPEQERRIGRLAIENHLIFEAVMSWMDDQPWPADGAPHKPRREDAPMWKDASAARKRLYSALDDACGFVKMEGGGISRRWVADQEDDQ